MVVERNPTLKGSEVIGKSRVVWFDGYEVKPIARDWI